MIFGCGFIGTVAYHIICEQYPNAHFWGSIDNYVTGMWKGGGLLKQLMTF